MRIPISVLIALVIAGLLLVSPAVAAETAQYYFDQGIVFNDRGQHDKALDAYEHGIELEPGNARLWGARGRTLLILGRYQESADAYNRSVQLDPSQEYAREGVQDALDKLNGVSNATTTPAAGLPWWTAVLPITWAAIAARGLRH